MITADFRPKLWAYIVGICKNHGVVVDAIGGVDDHIHILLRLPAKVPLSDVVLAIKSGSSRWAHQARLPFEWQEGYAAFSVSESNVPAVSRYIQNQQEHHKRLTFDEEFTALLTKHHVEFDPKFVLG